MARQVGVPASHLSNVLNGKANLSPSTANRVATKLGLRNTEKEAFVLMVQFESERDAEFRNTIQERLNELRPDTQVYNPDIDLFKTISDWHHLAILDLMSLKGAPTDPRALPSWISRRLAISTLEAENAIERLIRLDLLKRLPNGMVECTAEQIQFSSTNANEALRNFHRQTLNKALLAIESQTPAEKFIGSRTFAADVSQLEEARELSRKYFASLVKVFRKGTNKTEIYHAGVQIFRLTEKDKS